MMEMKNAPTSAATLTGTVDSGAVCKAAQPSTTKFTTFGGSGQTFRVADLLPPGQQNAVPLRYLKQLTHLPRRRSSADGVSCSEGGERP